MAKTSDLARVCPAPTTVVRQKAILRYLESAPPSPDLDVLATEWERLDDGARKARGSAK